MQVHNTVFAHAHHAGRFRQVPVRIGNFLPPKPDLLPRLMENLEAAYADAQPDAETLASWYTDFETIHPFQDGNGRVGGIIVAALNRNNDPSQWMTPGTVNQRQEEAAPAALPDATPKQNTEVKYPTQPIGQTRKQYNNHGWPMVNLPAEVKIK